MMEKRNTPAGEPCRDWKDTLWDVLFAASLVIIGVAVGIGLCKFCPPFWRWLNGGWMETPWIPRAIFMAGAVCFSVGMCIKEANDD